VILPDERFLAPPQVTAMDEQFGTHRLKLTLEFTAVVRYASAVLRQLDLLAT